MYVYPYIRISVYATYTRVYVQPSWDEGGWWWWRGRGCEHCIGAVDLRFSLFIPGVRVTGPAIPRGVKKVWSAIKAEVGVPVGTFGFTGLSFLSRTSATHLVSLRRVLHFQDRQDSFNVAGHFAELRDVDNGVELRRQVRALQDVQVGRGAQDQQLLPRGGGRPQQRQDGLQQRVGEARAQMHVLDQALDVVQNDDAEGGLVRVIEDLTDQIAFRDLSVAASGRGPKCGRGKGMRKDV